LRRNWTLDVEWHVRLHVHWGDHRTRVNRISVWHSVSLRRERTIDWHWYKGELRHSLDFSRFNWSLSGSFSRIDNVDGLRSRGSVSVASSSSASRSVVRVHLQESNEDTRVFQSNSLEDEEAEKEDVRPERAVVAVDDQGNDGDQSQDVQGNREGKVGS